MLFSTDTGLVTPGYTQLPSTAILGGFEADNRGNAGSRRPIDCRGRLEQSDEGCGCVLLGDLDGGGDKGTT